MTLSNKQFVLIFIGALCGAILLRASLLGFTPSVVFGASPGSPFIHHIDKFYGELFVAFGGFVSMAVTFFMFRTPLIIVDWHLAKLLSLKDKLEPELKQINDRYIVGSQRTIATSRLFQEHAYRPFLLLPLFLLKFGTPLFFYFTIYSNYPIENANLIVSTVITLLAVLAIGYTNFTRFQNSTSNYHKIIVLIGFSLLSSLAIFLLPLHLLFFILLMHLTNTLSEVYCKHQIISTHLEFNKNAKTA